MIQRQMANTLQPIGSSFLVLKRTWFAVGVVLGGFLYPAYLIGWTQPPAHPVIGGFQLLGTALFGGTFVGAIALSVRGWWFGLSSDRPGRLASWVLGYAGGCMALALLYNVLGWITGENTDHWFTNCPVWIAAGRGFLVGLPFGIITVGTQLGNKINSTDPIATPEDPPPTENA